MWIKACWILSRCKKEFYMKYCCKNWAFSVCICDSLFIIKRILKTQRKKLIWYLQNWTWKHGKIRRETASTVFGGTYDKEFQICHRFNERMLDCKIKFWVLMQKERNNNWRMRIDKYEMYSFINLVLFRILYSSLFLCKSRVFRWTLKRDFIVSQKEQFFHSPFLCVRHYCCIMFEIGRAWRGSSS